MTRHRLSLAIATATASGLAVSLGAVAVRRLRAARDRAYAIVADLGEPGRRTVIYTGRRADVERLLPRLSPDFGRAEIEMAPKAE